ncbi:hypothetical protein [uncultured Deefgea sp.]|uniref:hypothetical protein n=1 Tax=uncultured Deefgea sp. TaxID=1304914 RepID=UPI002621C32A|nr:hypothetical protein [uncultured Deefgea sp.]
MLTLLQRLPTALRCQALGTAFYRESPTPMPEATVVAWDAPLANTLGSVDVWLAAHNEQLQLADYLVGNQTPQDSTPIATVYSGH